MISVPNGDSLQAHLGGERWFHLDLPRHLFQFTPRSLAALIERAGLRVVRIGHLYPEMEAIGLVQTTLNRAGFEDDLLYRFAKRDPSARSGPRVSPPPGTGTGRAGRSRLVWDRASALGRERAFNWSPNAPRRTFPLLPYGPKARCRKAAI